MFLVNNDGYTIEVEIHGRDWRAVRVVRARGLRDCPRAHILPPPPSADGEYNNIQPWDDCKVVEGFKGASSAKLLTRRATTEAELKAAIADAVARPDHMAFIEFVVARDDCSRELLEWGSRVAAANGRAPDPR